ncbi:hypothetical protein GCM10010429_27100 [Micromonospora olivasterospora]|uniref:Uncharacterized protein n=1 Tax=Micromonospora olivasterospora TaxID=1880 RepID=A0A562IGW5_MICOL|nr:hypothetical protein JD77_05087 [Micromonospora olivasterospora]
MHRLDVSAAGPDGGQVGGARLGEALRVQRWDAGRLPRGPVRHHLRVEGHVQLSYPPVVTDIVSMPRRNRLPL